LQDPLLMSAIEFGDSNDLIEKKLDAVARFTETFTARRSVNYKKFGQAALFLLSINSE